MRILTETYDYVFVDIDDTLIHGWYIKLMHYTWMWFRNNTLSALLMHIQNKFNIYKVDEKLLYYLGYNSDNIVFLTVRAYSSATVKMVNKIMAKHNGTDRNYCVVALGTDNGHEDKTKFIKHFFEGFKCLLIDDNIKNRYYAEANGIDTIDPLAFRERLVW